MEVDPEDLGKVIGRGGRVAQALRTIVRAGVEGRVTIDIIDVRDEEDDDDEDEDGSVVLVKAEKRGAAEWWLRVGRVSGVAGTRGELKIAVSRVGEQAIAVGTPLLLTQGRANVTAVVTGLRAASAGIVAGASRVWIDRNAAERLIEKPRLPPNATFVELAPGEYLDADLEGLRLLDPKAVANSAPSPASRTTRARPPGARWFARACAAGGGVRSGDRPRAPHDRRRLTRGLARELGFGRRRSGVGLADGVKAASRACATALSIATCTYELPASLSAWPLFSGSEAPAQL